MADDVPNLKGSRTPSRSPIHALPASLGASWLIGALVTDLLYWSTLNGQWETFSIWLLTGGLILAAVAGLALGAEVLLHRIGALNWIRFWALTAAAFISLINAFIHSRDGYAAVVPTGLALSACVAIILLAVGWRGWSLTQDTGAQS